MGPKNSLTPPFFIDVPVAWSVSVKAYLLGESILPMFLRFCGWILFSFYYILCNKNVDIKFLKIERSERQIKESFGAIKPKDLNRKVKIDQGQICVREENLTVLLNLLLCTLNITNAICHRNTGVKYVTETLV